MNYLFLTLNFIYFILSSFGWPTTYLSETKVALFGVVLYGGYFIFNDIKFEFNSNVKKLIISFLIFAAYFVCLGSYTTVLKYIPAFLLCLLPRAQKLQLLKFITKWFSISISISLLVYGLTFIVTLPSFGTINHYIYEPYTNYLVYIMSSDPLTALRFNGFFFEPGHCALVGVFILFANRFQFRNNYYLIPILVTILFTLSLAGYLLIIIGLCLLYVRRLETILIGIAMMAIGYIFVAYIWSEGENPVNELIVARLEFDDEGGIKGNNRAYLDTDKLFDKSLKNGDIWTGIGITKFNDLFNKSIAGSGIKVFILQFGIIGVFLTFLLYWGYGETATSKNKTFAILFLIFISIAFIQRCYAFWFSWQLPYICGIVSSNSKKNRHAPKEKSNTQLNK